MYFFLWFVLTLFAGLRYVQNGIGGMDGSSYEYMLLHPTDPWLTDLEEFFVFYTQCIASFTSNPIIYRLISYGIIAYGYIYVLYKLGDAKKMSAIPFLLIIFPYLRSFNTMRNSLAIAVFLIGIVMLYDRKNICGILFIVATCFIHRMSVLYVLFVPFYFLFKNYDFTDNKRIALFIIVFGGIGYIAALSLRTFILDSAGLSEHDLYYLSSSAENTLLGRIPMIFQHVILLFTLCVWNNKLPDTPILRFIRLLVVFDLIIIPTSVALGMWRALEYMYIPRLIMWAYLIPVIIKPFNATSRTLLKIGFLAVFSFWLIFRINQEWEAAGLLPYILAI